MRLCLITPGFSASEDDWCIPVLHHLVRRLAVDHQVTVMALRHPPRRSPYQFFGARVVPFAAANRTGVWRAALLLRALVAVRREHRRSTFDAIHGLWADEAGFIAATAGRWLGVRSVVSVMGGELVGLPDIGYGVQLGCAGRWLVRRSLTRANRVTLGSRGLLESVRRHRPHAPVTVAPLGVDTELFLPDGDQADLPGHPCLLQVASLAPVKNQALLLDAFASVARSCPGAHLHVVGEGPLRDFLVSRAAALGVGDAVHIHGPIAHHKLAPFYRAADLHVQSSRFESQGMAVLEAAACGTATIGTAVGILPELSSDGVAKVVSSNDADDLSAALLETLDEKGRPRSLGAAAMARIRDGLTVDQCTRRIVDLLMGTASPAGTR